MTTDFKYHPRSPTRPTDLQRRLDEAGISADAADQLLNLYSDPLVYIEHQAKDPLTLSRRIMAYLDVFEAFERETDPERSRALDRLSRVQRDYDDLVPSIRTMSRAEFESDAWAQHHLTLVLFYSSPGCPFCIPLAATMEQLARENPDIRFLKINSVTDSEIAKRMLVRGLPTYVLFRGGSLGAAGMGAKPIEDLRAWLALATQGTPRPARAQCADGVCAVPG